MAFSPIKRTYGGLSNEDASPQVTLLEGFKLFRTFEEQGSVDEKVYTLFKRHDWSSLIGDHEDKFLTIIQSTEGSFIRLRMIEHLIGSRNLSVKSVDGILSQIQNLKSSTYQAEAMLYLVNQKPQALKEEGGKLLQSAISIPDESIHRLLILEMDRRDDDFIKNQSQQLLEIAKGCTDKDLQGAILNLLSKRNLPFVDQNAEVFFELFCGINYSYIYTKKIIFDGFKNDRSFLKNHASRLLKIGAQSSGEFIFELLDTFVAVCPEFVRDNRKEIAEIINSIGLYVLMELMESHPKFAKEYEKEILSITLELGDANKKKRMLEYFIAKDSHFLEKYRTEIQEIAKTLDTYKEK